VDKHVGVRGYLVLGGTLFLALLLQAFLRAGVGAVVTGRRAGRRGRYVVFDRAASVLRVQLLVCAAC